MVTNIAPYPQKAYEQFYECEINGISAEEHIIRMFTNRSSIKNFLNTAYDFIEMNKDLILESM